MVHLNEYFQSKPNDTRVVGTEEIPEASAAYRGNRIQKIGVNLVLDGSMATASSTSRPIYTYLLTDSGDLHYSTPAHMEGP